MSTILGKRKHREKHENPQRKEPEEGSELLEYDAQEIFRQHFETQFEPLSIVPKTVDTVVAAPDDYDSDDVNNESEWDGISEEETAVQVIEHTENKSRTSAMSKAEFKAFMASAIPPKSTTPIPTVSNAVANEDDASEAANIKKDLALQRLLAESHLLDSAQNLTHSGSNRHKATDLRIQALGSKDSILKQEKMPMSHRKGIIAKQVEKESKRRKDAKENGIILERVSMGNKKNTFVKRDRGFGVSVLGRFSRGKLQLSKKDISEIEGPRRSSSKRGGRGGGRKAKGKAR